MCICMYACVCKCVYIYTHIHVYVYIHMLVYRFVDLFICSWYHLYTLWKWRRDSYKAAILCIVSFVGFHANCRGAVHLLQVHGASNSSTAPLQNNRRFNTPRRYSLRPDFACFCRADVVEALRRFCAGSPLKTALFSILNLKQSPLKTALFSKPS